MKSKEQRIEIKGFLPVTLLDWPGKITSMVFLGGCNFRCPFCYNLDLVLRPDSLKTIPFEDILDYLKQKEKWIDGVVISGGEPTIHPWLPALCQKLKEHHLLVQIQTNGTNPRMLKELLNQKLVDFIAMDIKGPLEKYPSIVRVPVKQEEIQESVKLIIQHQTKIETEFRTTVVPGLLGAEEIEEIGQWLGPDCPVDYFLQQFSPQITLESHFAKIKPYSLKQLNQFLKIAQKYFRKVKLRGI